MQVFESNPWFGRLPQPAAGALLAATVPLRLARGAALYCQGDVLAPNGAAFFGVVQGTMKLSVLHERGKENILILIEPGNWFGEVALLDNMQRVHTASALDECALLAVSGRDFDALMRDAAFAHAVARLVAGRLRLAYGALADAALQSTRERVVRRLLLLAYGGLTQAPDRRSLIATSQDNLAMMLGISRPTLNKELQTLAKLGALSLRYGRIEIKDMTLLQACSNDG